MLKLYGGQTVNGFWMKNYSLNSTELTNIKSSDANWTWDFSTIALAKFNSSLQAGNIDLSELLNTWEVRKINVSNNDTLYSKIGVTSDSNVMSIRDYLVNNGQTYKYQIIGKTNNYLTDAIYSDDITADFWYWSLIDVVTHNIFKFRLNAEEGSITTNTNTSITIVNNRYPVFSQGLASFKSGTFTSLISDVDTSNNYTDTVLLREQLIEFINNGNQKLMKFPKGDSRLVNTSTNSHTTDNQTLQQQQSITFTWTETGTIEDLGLYDEL